MRNKTGAKRKTEREEEVGQRRKRRYWKKAQLKMEKENKGNRRVDIRKEGFRD